VGTDKTTDLAVIKIDATGLTPAALGDSDVLEVGETVVAIGNPLGETLAGSVTSGIVSALNRDISTKGYSQQYIQTDAAINPGNSGGALVNMKGQVIGINTLKTYMAGYDDYGVPIGTEGIGFAIPINHAKPIIEQLIATGSVERPGIGINCLVDETNQYNAAGAPTGVTVAGVTKNGPAEKAGLEAGDIIIAIDGVAVDTVEALTTALKSHTIGQQVELTVWRSGQEYKAVVTIGDLNNME
jgi:serine protease Do